MAETQAKLIDGVAVARFRAGVLLAWSDSLGLYARPLDAWGKPAAPTVRLAERCDGGIALASSAAGLALACSRRAVPRDVDQPGSAGVYRVAHEGPSLVATELATFSPAGSLSEGISLAWVDAPGSGDPPVLALAWHDGSPDVQRIWLVSDVAGETPAQSVSTQASVAHAPMLAARGRRLALTWGERVTQGDSIESAAMLWTGEARLDAARGKATAVAYGGEPRASWVEPLPQLAFLGDELVIGYRAPGQHGKKAGLQLAHVRGEVGAHGVMAEPSAPEPKRVGRADGVGSPSLTACMGGLVAATPRSYSGDYFIGINWLSGALEHPRREQQFYEDAHAFTQTAGVCLGDHALLALAELPPLDQPKAQLHVATYACQ